MDRKSSVTMLAAALAGVALIGAGCGDRSSNETVGQKLERTTDKMAAATDNATAKAAMAVDDSSITVKVKSAMVADPALKALEIKVDTKDGVVTLAGSVDSQAMKDRATEVTQQVAGVKSVDNTLTIKTTG